MMAVGNSAFGASLVIFILGGERQSILSLVISFQHFVLLMKHKIQNQDGTVWALMRLIYNDIV